MEGVWGTIDTPDLKQKTSLSTMNFCSQWYFPAVFLKSASGIHALIAKWWIPGISGNKLPAVWVEVFKCLLFFIIQVVSPYVTPAREQGGHMYGVTWLAKHEDHVWCWIYLIMSYSWQLGSCWICFGNFGWKVHHNALIYRIYTEF